MKRRVWTRCVWQTALFLICRGFFVHCCRFIIIRVVFSGSRMLSVTFTFMLLRVVGRRQPQRTCRKVRQGVASGDERSVYYLRSPLEILRKRLLILELIPMVYLILIIYKFFFFKFLFLFVAPLFAVELTDFRGRRIGHFKKNLVELAELELKHARVRFSATMPSFSKYKTRWLLS